MAAGAPGQSFDDVRAQVERVVKKVFPKAEAVAEFGMKGWRIARPKGAPRYERAGTMPPDFTYVFLAGRKAGPTLHLWYPAPGGIEASKAALAEAGFKVMVGCLVFSKKQPYPIEAVEALLRDVKARDRAK